MKKVMKKTVFILLMIGCCCPSVWSQSEKADSLFIIGERLFKDGQYSKALDKMESAAGIVKHRYGKKSPEYAITLSQLSKYYAISSDFPRAISMGKVALRILASGNHEDDYGSYCSTLADAIWGYMDAYYNSKEYIQPFVDFGNEIITYIGNNRFAEDDNYIHAMMMAGKALMDTEDFESAVKAYQEAKRVIIDINGEEEVCLDVVKHLAQCYMESGHYGSAIVYYYDVLARIENLYGAGEEYAEVADEIASLYDEMDNPQAVIKTYVMAKDKIQKAEGKTFAYFEMVDALADAYGNVEDMENEMAMKKEAFETRKALLGGSPDWFIKKAYFEILLDAPYEVIIMYLSAAIDILEKRGTTDADYIENALILSNYYARNGDYDHAISLAYSAVSGISKVKGRENMEYVYGIDVLADSYRLKGDYIAAQDLLDEAAAISESLGDTSNTHAKILYHKALIAKNLSDYKTAVDWGLSSLAMFDKNTSEKNVELRVPILQLIGFCLYKNGDHKEAVTRMSEAISLQQSSHTETFRYASLLNDISLMLYSAGEYENSISHAEEAERILKTMRGGDAEGLSAIYNNLSLAYGGKGDYANAEKYLLKALEKEKNHDKKGNLISLMNMASLSASMNDKERTSYYSSLALNGFRDYIVKNFGLITSFERERLWNEYRFFPESDLQEYAFKISSEDLVKSGYDGILFAKGLLLGSEMEFSRIIQEGGDQESLSLYEHLRSIRSLINQLSGVPSAERPIDVDLDSLEVESQKTERALIARSKEYGDYTRNLAIDWKQVRDCLADEDVAIEFVSFPIGQDSTMYAAYVLRKACSAPHLVPLFEENQLKRIPLDSIYGTTRVAELVWKPLDADMEGVRNVFFSPSGELYNISVESLPDWKHDGIISDMRKYYRLSSTRQLVFPAKKQEWKSAVVYGGFQFDMEEGELVSDSQRYGMDSLVNKKTSNVTHSLCIGPAGALPGTLTEAMRVYSILMNLNIPTSLYCNAMGTEASFKSLSGKRVNLLHVATHGFYCSDKEYSKNVNHSSFRGLSDVRYQTEEDESLTRAGILFSGANYTLGGNNKLPAGIEDGILTAKELSTMDLRGLDLVILSACQSGLGDVNGDGVYGVQRGFKKAGANTILMSLWKVDDHATQLLMERFIENLSKHKNKHDALLNAQHYVREYDFSSDEKNISRDPQQRKERRKKQEQGGPDGNKVYSNPYYWAAFVLLDGMN